MPGRRRCDTTTSGPSEWPLRARGPTIFPNRQCAAANRFRAVESVLPLSFGTLQVGAPGDVTMLEVVEGPVEFVDTRNNKRVGKVYVKPVQTVAAGIAFGRPYSAPFGVR